MITDNQLYSLAIFLGSLSMLLIVLYHFLEVNSKEDDDVNGADNTTKNVSPAQQKQQQQAAGEKEKEKAGAKSSSLHGQGQGQPQQGKTGAR
ncbi:hypothetical protein MMC24_005912 [Lignoscripta atroalba]|nr:hypothetical protein [Lignoscripta atroalba]